MAYLLDSNVFIEANNRYYAFDICPGFWGWLRTAHDAGRVFSIESVKQELTSRDDDLSTWVEALPGSFFLPVTAADMPGLATVSTQVTTMGYEPAAINDFLAVADFFLIAQAQVAGHTVITHEVFASSAKKIKIPNVCIPLRVPFMTPFAMLRAERARFVLSNPS
ncbi:MAG: hypothetical protein BGO26_08600 [Actinobacteria bacterium 69-20]|jgi:hypothetical protein|nr:DUF4411 family protein [Actinomycetota bacterium]OJV25765.1 MAG: hypothetical protein BGO26_08600 [Actinobacteria bacterium 69-20]